MDKRRKKNFIFLAVYLVSFCLATLLYAGAVLAYTVPHLSNSVTVKIKITPALVDPPTDKDQCKDDGWKIFNNPTFKNQGDCVSWLQSNSNAEGNKKNN